MFSSFTKKSTIILVIIMSLGLIISGCGGGGSSGGGIGGGGSDGGSALLPTPAPTGTTQTQSISGSVKDAAGQPVAGALVIAGSNSATVYTDDQGNFEITTTATGSQPVTVIAPGYRARSHTPGQGQSTVNICLDEDSAVESDPVVKINRLKVTDSGIDVTATVTAAPDALIVDVRAELVGTAFGAVLSKGAGNNYTGTIATTEKNGTVLVFAIDDQDRHGQDTKDLGGGSGGASTGARESWKGTIHGFSQGGNDYQEHFFNAALTIETDGSASAIGVFLRPDALKEGQSPVATERFTGTAKTTGKNYRVDLANSSGTISIDFNGRVKSDGSAYAGSVNGKIDNKPYKGTFLFVNSGVTPIVWQDSDLEGTFGLSFFYARQPDLSPPHYQYNMLLTVDSSGSVTPGTPVTIGPVTGQGGTLKFADVEGENLGYFTGSPGVVLKDNTNYAIHCLMNVRKKHVRGVWGSSAPGYGTLWGMKNPSWSAADFDAQWQGFFSVLEGPDRGKILNAQVNINPEGSVTGSGSIVAGKDGTLTGGNISLQSGTLSFTNSAVGGFTGQFIGKQQSDDVTVNMSTPSAPETASMGVYHCRLIGRFEISSNGDKGSYFLHRNSKR